MEEKQCRGRTSYRLTCRTGLTLFVEHFHRIQILPFLDRFFGTICKIKKGVAAFGIFISLVVWEEPSFQNSNSNHKFRKLVGNIVLQRTLISA